MSDITIAAGDGGSFSAYLAVPDAIPAPGILLIQEIFGVNDVMRTIADGFANLGFVTLCPDLFWRQEPGIQISDKTEEEWQRAFQLYQGFDSAKGMEDLGTSLAHLRGLEECNGKAGCVGFCLGGSLTYFMAANTDVDASVGYYGIGIEGALDQAAGITHPLMLHIAENDDFVPAEAQAAMKEGLSGNDLVTIHTYPGAGHAFARIGGTTYNGDAAATANQRTVDFLKSNLA